MTAAIMIQLITGAIGSVGFGILFHIKNKYLPSTVEDMSHFARMLAKGGLWKGKRILGKCFSSDSDGWLCYRCVCRNSCKNL